MAPSPRWLPLLAVLFLLAPSTGDAVLPPYHIGTYGVGQVSIPYGIAINSNGDTYVVSSGSYRVEKFSKYGTHLLGWGSFGTGPGQFDFPFGIAVAPNGNVHVIDANANRVQMFTSSGGYITQFGSPGSGPGEFSSPHGIAIDGAGDIYVIDTFNHRVQRFEPSGAYLQEWGSLGSANGQFLYPEGIAVGPDGLVYVTDTYNHRIQVFDASGSFVRKWGSEGTGEGQFQFPVGIQVDAGGNVYVTDVNNQRLQRFTSTGVFVAKWGEPGSGPGQFGVPRGVAVASNGDVHVADTNNHRVQFFRTRFMSRHEALFALGSPGSGNGEFSDIRGVAVDRANGKFYVVDKATHRIQRYNKLGNWEAAWGTFGTGNGQLNGPTGIAVDTNGFVYVTDKANARVQKLTSDGVYVSQWGTAGSGPSQFNPGLWDIAIDGANNVYVVDADRVQKFTPSGVYVTEWPCTGAEGIGTDLEGSVYVACTLEHKIRKFLPDGTFLREWGSPGANPGQFFHPSDVVADSTGNVFVCDANNRMQKFTAVGGYLTEWGEMGSALNQLHAPQMMATDPAGSVFVTEFSNYRVQKFCSPPQLLQIADIPGDEGGWVKVTFSRSSAEDPPIGILNEYTVYRLDQSPPAYVLLATIPVDGVTTTAIVRTNGHATDVFHGVGEFEVRGLVAVGGAFVPRETNFGFSVDNLAPPAPAPLTGVYGSGVTALHWGLSPATDLEEYRLYRSNSEPVDLSPANLIHTSPDTGYADPGPAGRYYGLVAADTSGNVSSPALLGPDQTVSVPGDEASLDFRLDAITPNPARGTDLHVHFALPDAGKAQLDLIDIAGRRVWSQEVAGAGPHSLEVNSGGGLGPGVYFVRLTRNKSSLVRRVAVVD